MMTRFTKPSCGLQCFNPHKYVSYDECCTTPGVCIAPTTKGSRCSWNITVEDQLKAAQHLLQAGKCLDHVERQLEIARFVMLHCCKKQHRWRLEGDATDCLETLVKMYEAAMLIVMPDLVHTRLVSLDQPAGMTLRSGMVVKSLSETLETHCMHKEYFIPYESDPCDTVREELSKSIPNEWADEGEVYSFQWPEYPDFVKIGFSAWSAEERVEEWTVCNPGATLSKNMFVDYPKRVERLIHLELARDRYRIAICKVCGCSHDEYFKLPVNEVNQVITDWAILTRREPLYYMNGELTIAWRSRLQYLPRDITALVLHDVLNKEAACTRRMQVSLDLSTDSSAINTFSLKTSESSELAGQDRDIALEYLADFMSMVAITETATVSDGE